MLGFKVARKYLIKSFHYSKCQVAEKANGQCIAKLIIFIYAEASIKQKKSCFKFYLSKS